MAKEIDSREKTVIAAAKLLRRNGYCGTALSDILEASGAPRGSLYFHFPKGKEEIGEAALNFAAEAIRGGIAAAAKSSQSAEIFLSRIVRAMASDLERSDYTEGCPIATTALEISDQSTLVGTAAREGFQKWEKEIRNGLQLFGLDAKRADLVATQFLSQIEGALLLSRVHKDSGPMHKALKAIPVLLR